MEGDGGGALSAASIRKKAIEVGSRVDALQTGMTMVATAPTHHRERPRRDEEQRTAQAGRAAADGVEELAGGRRGRDAERHELTPGEELVGGEHGGHGGASREEEPGEELALPASACPPRWPTTSSGVLGELHNGGRHGHEEEHGEVKKKHTKIAVLPTVELGGGVCPGRS